MTDERTSNAMQASEKQFSTSDIDMIVLDFDGVLTDNRVLVLQDGTEGVFCNRSDGLAISAFLKASIPVMILSTEGNPVVTARGKKLKIPVLQGSSDKAESINTICKERGIALERVMYVGNDINDIPPMKLVGYPIAVSDAYPIIKSMAYLTLNTPGGYGTIRELVEYFSDIEFL